MRDPWATLRALAGDRVAGAAEIARRAAEALGLIAPEELVAAAELLLRGHPSMAPLWRLASEALAATDHREATVRFLATLDEDRRAAAALAEVLPDVVLTISSSSAVREAVRLRRPSTVLCMESLPGGEGHRMASALAGWTTARVIADRDAIDRVPADAVLIGADAVTPSTVINKTGTRELAQAAARRGVPRYAAAGSAKLVGAELPAVEPFQATPLDLLTGIAVPDALLSPAEARAEAERATLHPSLRGLLTAVTARTP